MPSIRRRLLLTLLPGFAVLVAATVLIVDTFLVKAATAEFDDALVGRARAIVALTEQEDGHIELDYVPSQMPEFEREHRPDHFEIWLDDGTPLFRSGRLEGDLPRGAGPAEEAWSFEGPAGRHLRGVEVRWTPPVAQPDPGDDDPDAAGEAPQTTRSLTLVLARGRERLDGLLASMRLALVLGGFVLVLVAGLWSWHVVARGLRPLDRVAARVRRVDADALDTRLLGPETPRELVPLVSQLDDLVQRLGESFARERRFAGNLAHELRTPLAELRSLASVGARWPEDTDSVRRYFGDVSDVAARMEKLITDLLLLARCHAGVEGIHLEPTHVEALIAAAWQPLGSAARERDLTLELDVPADLVVASDAGKLHILFANLLGNAVHHARPHSEIRCTARRAGGHFEIELSNEAEGLTDEDVQRVAEPFWQKDAARSAPGHLGLGLSLVSAVAGLLGLDVRFGRDPSGRFRARLAGPLEARPKVAQR